MTEIVQYNGHGVLTTLDAIRQAIETADTFADTVDIRKRIDALLHVARAVDVSHEQMNDIARLKLEGIRKGGGLLAGLQKSPGKRRDLTSANALAEVSEYQLAVQEASVSEQTARLWQQVARLTEDAFYYYIDDTLGKGAELSMSGLLRYIRETQSADEEPDNNQEVHYSSETPEWYTPQFILDKVIQLMGAIDLDPCSNSHETPNVPAGNHYTEDDDGLNRAWQGRVYMNPPYGDVIKNWIEKLADEYEQGQVTEAIALVPSRTDTAWFRRLRNHPRCFVWGRLKFSNSENSAPFPSMLVYMGSNVRDFVSIFGDIGDIYVSLQL